MPFFRYSAINLIGNQETNLLFTENKEAAFQILQKRYVHIIRLEQESVIFSFMRYIKNNQLFKDEELALICRQFSNYLKNGQSLSGVLQIFSQEEKNKTKKAFWLQVLSDYQEGVELYLCLLPWEDRLPKIFLAVLQTAELTGEIEKSFHDLSMYFANSSRERKEYINLLVYPSVLIALIFGVSIFLSNFVLPSFVSLYAQDEQLPKATQILLLLGNKNFISIFLVFILLIVIIIVFIFTLAPDKWRILFQRKMLKLPLIGRYLLKQDLINLSSSLSLLLGCDIDLVKAWPCGIKTMSSLYLRSTMDNFLVEIEKGFDLHLVLMRCEEMPISFIEYVKHGERGNVLSESFGLIAENYRAESKFEAKKLRSLMEPLLTLLIALPIGFIAYAVLLPIMNQWQQNQFFK